MKYYAVTEDPNELFHYGVKGMKWGQHIFGKESRPKSAAYKRAASKLRSSMKSGARSVSSAARAAKNTIQKGAMQIAYNNRARQDRKYQKAVLKAQRSTSLTQALSNLDKENQFKKQVDLDRKREAIADKLTSIKDYNDYKSMKKSVKAEKKMPKLMQEAREGTLKYGKLSEEQIGRVQDRLALEASTRRLGSTEAPKFRKQMKMAVQQGLLQGTTSGIAAGMTEVARAKVQNKLRNKRELDKQNRIKAHREHEAQRIKNDRSHAEIREDLKTEAYISDLEAGKGGLKRMWGQRTAATAARRLEANKDADREKKERLEEARQLRIKEANDEYNDRRQEQQFLDAAKSAYEYGFVPAYLNNGTSVAKQKKTEALESGSGNGNNPGGGNQNGNGGGKKKNKGGGGGGKFIGEIDDLQKYYESRVVKNETIQQKKARKEAEETAEKARKDAEKKAEAMRRAFDAEQAEKRRQAEGRRKLAEEKEHEREKAQHVSKADQEKAARLYGERHVANEQAERERDQEFKRLYGAHAPGRNASRLTDGQQQKRRKRSSNGGYYATWR